MQRTNRIEIRPNGRNQFIISNGHDEIHARFVHGSGTGDTKQKAHWDVTYEDKTTSVFVGKEELVRQLTEKLTSPLETPLTKDQAMEIQTRDSCVHGIVHATLDELITHTNDGFIRLIIERLTEVPLTHIQYHIVAAGDDDLCLRVSETAAV